ncbi:MAG TPA: sulfatase [Pirellulaceae bacterium]|nr:sulfatase [Pirellulaceae bacterium]
MHRIVIAAAFGCLVLASNGLSAAPNLILFVTDDMGADAGCYGNSVIQTPNLDALARGGIRMTDAFCTTASCSASRSVILTGLYNHANAQFGHEHAYHHFRTYDNVKSLPVLLSAAGYRTAQIGKLHVGPPEVYKFDRMLPGNARSPVQMAENCRELIAEKSDKPFFLYFCTADPHRGGGKVGESRPPLRGGNGKTKSQEESGRATESRPTLLPDAFGNRPQGWPGIKEVKYEPKDVIVPPFLPDTPACRAELAQYYQSVSRIDQGLGRLMEILKETGHDDDTLVIFTSDHGIAFPGAKTNLYDAGMRVPMVVRLPAVRRGSPDPAESTDQRSPPGNESKRPTVGAVARSGDRPQQRRGQEPGDRVCHAMVNHADLTPTLLDFAGALPKDHKFHGRSWKNAVTEENPKGWDEVNASHTFHEITMYYPMKVVRMRTHKLIWNIAYPLPFPFASDLWEASTWQDVFQHGPDTAYGKRSVRQYIHRPQFELYDLAADPDETKNLADDPQHAKLLGELKEKLKAFQKRTEDPWILKWDYE